MTPQLDETRRLSESEIALLVHVFNPRGPGPLPDPGPLSSCFSGGRLDAREAPRGGRALGHLIERCSALEFDPARTRANRWRTLENAGDRWRPLETAGDRWRAAGDRWTPPARAGAAPRSPRRLTFIIFLLIKYYYSQKNRKTLINPSTYAPALYSEVSHIRNPVYKKLYTPSCCKN